MFDDAKYDEVVAHVRSLAVSEHVVEVRDHFAGYFNELGLRVRFSDSATDRDVITLGNALLGYLNQSLPPNNEYFCWILSLERASTKLDVLTSGDKPRDVNEKLRPLK